LGLAVEPPWGNSGQRQFSQHPRVRRVQFRAPELPMADAIAARVNAIRKWAPWNPASRSPVLLHLAENDGWLRSYFTRRSTINSCRHYLGVPIHAVTVPRCIADRIPGKETFRVAVKQRFSIHGERLVYLLIGENRLEWSACGTVQEDGSVKNGCISAYACYRANATDSPTVHKVAAHTFVPQYCT